MVDYCPTWIESRNVALHKNRAVEKIKLTIDFFVWAVMKGATTCEWGAILSRTREKAGAANVMGALVYIVTRPLRTSRRRERFPLLSLLFRVCAYLSSGVLIFRPASLVGPFSARARARRRWVARAAPIVMAASVLSARLTKPQRRHGSSERS